MGTIRALWSKLAPKHLPAYAVPRVAGGLLFTLAGLGLLNQVLSDMADHADQLAQLIESHSRTVADSVGFERTVLGPEYPAREDADPLGRADLDGEVVDEP